MQTDRTLAAAGFAAIFAATIGLTDNFVRIIAAEGGLWQFHATRSVMALAVLVLVARVVGLRLVPRRIGRVAARSAIQAVAVMIYFGALAFLPVAQVAAGLFTAPIFVLLISWLVFKHSIGPVRVWAVVIGFVGVVLVLGPEAIRGASIAALAPVVAAVFYAVSNLATREWCAGETAATLTLGFFVALLVVGLGGMVLLYVFPQIVPEGTAGFVLRGPVWPSTTFMGWTFVQAVGSLFGVAAIMRAYQIAEASRVSVFEYLTLPASAFWGWMIWAEELTGLAIVGMVLITLAGTMIALRARQAELSPTA